MARPGFCRQIAYYLLGNETLSTQAATQALIELLKDEDLY